MFGCPGMVMMLMPVDGGGSGSSTGSAAVAGASGVVCDRQLAAIAVALIPYCMTL